MKERPYETRLPQLEMRAEGLLTDKLTIDFFRLEKDGTFFSFLFFFSYLCCSPVSSWFDEREAVAFSRNDNFSSTHLHDPYGIGKLSIS